MFRMFLCTYIPMYSTLFTLFTTPTTALCSLPVILVLVVALDTFTFNLTSHLCPSYSFAFPGDSLSFGDIPLTFHLRIMFPYSTYYVRTYIQFWFHRLWWNLCYGVVNRSLFPTKQPKGRYVGVHAYAFSTYVNKVKKYWYETNWDH